MFNRSRGERQPQPNELILPPYNPSEELQGLFWIDPDTIDEVSELINHTRLSTMEMGAGSRQQMFVEERSTLKDSLIAEDDPDAEIMRRAVRIGFLYGSLLGKRSETPSEREDPTGSALYE